MLNLFEIFFAWKYSVSKEGRAEIEAERARIFQEEDEAICNAIANGSADTLPLGLYKTSRGRIVRKLPHSQWAAVSTLRGDDDTTYYDLDAGCIGRHFWTVKSKHYNSCVVNYSKIVETFGEVVSKYRP